MNMMNNLKELVQKGLGLTAANDGATLLKNGKEATRGYAVGGIHEVKLRYQQDKETLERSVLESLEDIQTIDCDAYGFWLDAETLYIDAVRIYQDVTEALAFAAKNDEIAIFCIHTQDEIRL